MGCCGKNNKMNAFANPNIDNTTPIPLKFLLKRAATTYVGKATGFLYRAGGKFEYILVHPDDAPYFLSLSRRSGNLFEIVEDENELPEEMRRGQAQISREETTQTDNDPEQEPEPSSDNSTPETTAAADTEYNGDDNNSGYDDLTQIIHIGFAKATYLNANDVFTFEEFVAKGVNWVAMMSGMNEEKAREAIQHATELLG